MALIWITGARGFIGRNLAAHLAAQGHRVAGIGHGAWADAEAMAWGVAHWTNGDIQASNLENLRRNFGAPDCIYHLAGGSSVGAAIAAPHEDFFRTVASTVNLLDWMRLESPTTRSVVVSSAAVYGAGHSGPIAEDTQGTPYSPYGYHKLMMEQLCRSYGASYGLQSVVARLFSVYGKGLRKQLLWDLCGKLSRNTGQIELAGSGDELRDWVDIRDVARVLARLPDAATAESPALNVGMAKATSVREIVELALSAWPSPAQISFSGQSRPGDPFSLVADNTRLALGGLDWQVPVEQGIPDYVRWYLQQAEQTPC
ncbi:MAG TPA: NAD(P)-dependent oxidoreductase [Rhodocyclaceae bacterium]